MWNARWSRNMESMPTEIELKGTGWKKPDKDNHTKT